MVNAFGRYEFRSCGDDLPPEEERREVFNTKVKRVTNHTGRKVLSKAEVALHVMSLSKSYRRMKHNARKSGNRAASVMIEKAIQQENLRNSKALERSVSRRSISRKVSQGRV